MPVVVFQKGEGTFTDEVPDNANLVVRAGIKNYPWPHLRYGCGMGKCAKCACRVLSGAEHLPAPNWKEEKQLGDRIAEGYRLVCQIWLTHDVSLVQDEVAVPPRGT